MTAHKKRYANIPVAAALLAVTGLSSIGCQEALTLAEEEVPVETPTPLVLPKLDICGVIPMAEVSIEAIAPFSDGAVAVAGALGLDSAEHTVFGKGEPNETSLPPDPHGPNGGFIAKYSAEGQLAWAVGGVDRVTQLFAAADGTVTAVIPASAYSDTTQMQIISIASSVPQRPSSKWNRGIWRSSPTAARSTLPAHFPIR